MICEVYCMISPDIRGTGDAAAAAALRACRVMSSLFLMIWSWACRRTSILCLSVVDENLVGMLWKFRPDIILLCDMTGCNDFILAERPLFGSSRSFGAFGKVAASDRCPGAFLLLM